MGAQDKRRAAYPCRLLMSEWENARHFLRPCGEKLTNRLIFARFCMRLRALLRDALRLRHDPRENAPLPHTRRPPVFPRHRPTPPVLGFVPSSLSGILGTPETRTHRPMPKRPAILPPTLAPRGLSRTEAAAYIGVSPHALRSPGSRPAHAAAQADQCPHRLGPEKKKLDRAFELIPDGDHSDHNPWDD